jgi:hypothetical protein
MIAVPSAGFAKGAAFDPIEFARSPKKFSKSL